MENRYTPNTIMRDKLLAAINKLPPKQRTPLLGRDRRGRFQSLRTICTNDGAWGEIGTPCPRCGRTL